MQDWIWILAALLLLWAASPLYPSWTYVEDFPEPPTTETDGDMKPQLYSIGEVAHVAVGFGLANSILLEGPEGFLVVDTMENLEVASQVLAAFRAKTGVEQTVEDGKEKQMGE